MKKKLWTRNFTLIITASVLGMVGGVCGDYALSLLVFDKTGSTLASALSLAIQLVPYTIIPLFVAPLMDRLPRKPVLLVGDMINVILYGLLGLYLASGTFTYTGYLGFGLILAAIGAADQLAFTSFFPKLLPEGMEEKGYTVAAMTYPVLKVILSPAAVILYEKIGAANILLVQAGLSLLAVSIESFIQIKEEKPVYGDLFSFTKWKQDIHDTLHYLKNEKGLCNLYAYASFTGGVGNGYGPIIMAFFRTSSVLTMTMYSFFAVAEFLGRTIGGLFQYQLDISNEKKYGFCTMVYIVYDLFDAILLWLPYPLMLLNRVIAGALGINSGTMRQAAVQKYIPEEMRARINAFLDMAFMFCSSIMTLLMGMLGEVMDLRLCLTVGGTACLVVCLLTVVRAHKDVKKVFVPNLLNKG